MRFTGSFTKDVSLQQIEDFLNDVSLASARGEPRHQALAGALKRSTAPALRGMSPSYVFAKGEPVCSNSTVSASARPHAPAHQRLFQFLLPLLTLNQRGQCHLEQAKNFVSAVSKGTRWTEQQLAQAKGQCFFLMAFVPVVSTFSFLAGFANVSHNLSLPRGQLIFFSGLLFYLLGCISVAGVFRESRLILVSQALTTPAGRVQFFRQMLLSEATKASMAGALCETLILFEGKRPPRLSRAAFFAHNATAHPRMGRFWKREELNFISALFDVLLHACPALRRSYLRRAYESQLDALQLQVAEHAARLNLKLVLIMAIFFLPALFLMLCLSGTLENPIIIESESVRRSFVGLGDFTC